MVKIWLRTNQIGVILLPDDEYQGEKIFGEPISSSIMCQLTSMDRLLSGRAKTCKKYGREFEPHQFHRFSYGSVHSADNAASLTHNSYLLVIISFSLQINNNKIYINILSLVADRMASRRYYQK